MLIDSNIRNKDGMEIQPIHFICGLISSTHPIRTYCLVSLIALLAAAPSTSWAASGEPTHGCPVDPDPRHGDFVAVRSEDCSSLPWKVVKRHPAGTGGAGERLTVIEMQRPWSKGDGKRYGDDAGCFQRWLLEVKQPSGALKTSVVVANAYPFSWDHGVEIQDMRYEVGPNRFLIISSDNLLLHTISLSPLRVLDGVFSDPRITREINYRCCEVERENTCEPTTDESAPVKMDYLVLPAIPEISQFARHVWRTASWTDCAASGREEKGDILQRKGSGPLYFVPIRRRTSSANSPCGDSFR